MAVPMTSTAAPVTMTRRSANLSSRPGKTNAAIIEPPPNAANAQATSASPKPKRAFTRTTVFTITMAPAADTARLIASSPRSRGVAR